MTPVQYSRPGAKRRKLCRPAETYRAARRNAIKDRAKSITVAELKRRKGLPHE